MDQFLPLTWTKTTRSNGPLQLDKTQHLLVDCDPQYGIHKLVRLIKGRTSRYLRAEFPSLKRRLPSLWTNSYFVATVGGAPLAIVKQYVQNQRNV